MRVVIVGVGVAGLLVTAASAQQTQSEPKTCSDAYAPCKSQTGLPKECEAARQWCLKTGTFADPKTKSVSMGLRKK
jgi:hypothetical protein